MPRIGCGLDRLRWKKVREIIKSIFQDTDLEIEVYFNLPLEKTEYNLGGDKNGN